MDKKLFREYKKLDAKLKQMEEQKQALRDEIVEGLRKEGVEKTETDYGTFTRARRVSYKYTDAVKKLEEKVKLAKVKEEQKGLAEPSEKEYLVYSKLKDNS